MEQMVGDQAILSVPSTLPDHVAGRLKRELNFSDFGFWILELDLALVRHARANPTSSFNLMIVTTAQLYKVAYGKFAVGAYNINNMEQLLGLFGGNVQSQAPFIIQLSEGG
jgi:Fructose-bisphosphate aldolase class-II